MSAAESHPASTETGAEVLEQWKRFFESGDPEALASLYATDAFLEFSDLSIQAYGRTSILETFRKVLVGSTGAKVLWKNPAVGQGIVAAEYEISAGRIGGAGVAIMGISGAGIVFDKRFLLRVR